MLQTTSFSLAAKAFLKLPLLTPKLARRSARGGLLSLIIKHRPTLFFQRCSDQLRQCHSASLRPLQGSAADLASRADLSLM